MTTPRSTQLDADAARLQAEAAWLSSDPAAALVAHGSDNSAATIFWVFVWAAFVGAVPSIPSTPLGYAAQPHWLLALGFIAFGVVTLACLWAGVSMGTRGGAR